MFSSLWAYIFKFEFSKQVLSRFDLRFEFEFKLLIFLTNIYQDQDYGDIEQQDINLEADDEISEV